MSNLNLEQGVCFVQTDDDCTDILMRVPQALEVRPRCTMHGGSTIRQLEEDAVASETNDESGNTKMKSSRSGKLNFVPSVERNLYSSEGVLAP